MKKKLAVLMVLLGLGFGLTTAINWKGGNIVVSGNLNRTIAAPYVKSALWLQSQTTTTGSATIRGVGVVFNTTDFYPLNFKAGEVVTINSAVSVNVGYIWYENNDK